MIRNLAKEERIFLLLTLFLLVAGVVQRIVGIQSRNLEYDEIWTFANYVNLPIPAIFTDLATPNNHPLNTLLIQCSKSLFQDNQLMMLRFPSLLAGIFLLLMTPFAARRLTPTFAGGALILLILAFHVPLIHYAQTARGYELQTLFTAMTMLSLLFFEFDKESRPKRILWATLFLLSGIAACFSVTSGVIFVSAIAAAYLLTYNRVSDFVSFSAVKKKMELWIAFFLFAAFVLLWYGLQYETLKKGQSFGKDITSLWEFLSFIWKTFNALALFFPCALVLTVLTADRNSDRRKIAAMGLLATLFVLLSVFAFKAGDTRVYLPLLPILAFPAALIFGTLRSWTAHKHAVLFAAMLSACIVGLEFHRMAPNMHPPDMGTVFDAVYRDVPCQTLVIYSPTDSYIIASLFRERAAQDNLRRIAANPVSLILVGGGSSIGVFQEWDGGTSTYAIPSQPVARGTIAGEIDYSEYALRSLRENDILKGKVLICLMNRPSEALYAYCKAFFRGLFTTANFILSSEKISKNSSDSRSRILVFLSPEQSVAELLKLQKGSGSAIRFYVVEGQ